MTPDPADPNGEIHTALSTDPQVIDPQKASFRDEIAQTLMVYEPLLTFDPQSLRPIPAAARALPEVSPDGLTVTFTLRDGLMYSDGTPVRAEDFVNGWTRLCDPTVAGDYAFMGYAISGCERWNNMDPKRATPSELAAAGADLGVRALGEHRIQFALTRPASYFLAIAALWVGAPVRSSDVSAGGDRWTDPRTYIGNGPFKLVERTTGARLVYERNERYRSPVKLKRWTKLVVPDPAVQAAAFERGELDVISVGRDDPASVTVSNATTFFFGFNTQRPPFDDPSVRLAFARSLDREMLIREVVDQPARVWSSLIAPGLPGADPDDATQSFDPVAAKALLSSSRYAGKLPPVRFRYLYRGNAIAMVKWAIAQWRGVLGVEVLDDPVFPGASGPLIKSPEGIPQLFFLGWYGDYPDPHTWLSEIFRSTATITRTGYKSAEFDSLVDQADVERDPTRQAQLFRSAQRLLTRDAPAAFLYASERRIRVSARLRGYVATPTDGEVAQAALASLQTTRSQ